MDSMTVDIDSMNLAVTLIFLAGYVFGVFMGYLYGKGIIHAYVRKGMHWVGQRVPDKCEVEECTRTGIRWHEGTVQLPDHGTKHKACGMCVIRVANGQVLHIDGEVFDSGASLCHGS
jgi:hypothetical protein